MSHNSQKKVIVGMSGGVDSSVAAYLLLKQGYEVEGLFMKNWEEDDDEEYCAAAEDLADAQAVCNTLNIHLHTINFASEYWDNVFEHFLSEYKAGRTPNPDILCNKEIKFKVFPEFAYDVLGADYIAMGHYVRRFLSNKSRKPLMLRGIDSSKDQSYFLYTLGYEQINRSLFILGEFKKSEVRRIAEERGLITARKRDSTGICFIGKRKFTNFLSRYLTSEPGDIETPDGQIVGEHKGLMYHTLGQRKGLHIGGQKCGMNQPWYVAEKDLKRNVLIVVQGRGHPLLKSRGFFASQLHWIDRVPVTRPMRCTVQTRYRQIDVPCTLVPINNENINVFFDKPQIAVTPGQSAVFYLNDICLGGGIIERRI
ncbi:tRNA-specific 2-thiouridylase mnmA [Candidatus Photodesmus blepharus]|uniref:tRNA-specific 2-thiouridylase MnmA n=1 Tax=Candidatus Photodesmus blepharonis TaxID=1179155 RepID=A0A084CNA9_9GAMM|nr:tRNA 2-thiouridine(34) synthase MnmA [Candidatus Photodesmus blepharus]KEY91288.1 tRNA-specific 2-thiouridylase mnmA [Candidatus Photodesmus blepharus]